MIAVRFLPVAEMELLREVAYCSKAQTGLTVGFRALLRRRSSAPVDTLWVARSFKETRSVLVKGFAFSIVYKASADEVLVVAVAPHRKRPQYWSSRVE